MPSLADDLLNGAREAASFTGLTERTIYHLVEAGRLPATRVGKRIFFRKSELERTFSAGVRELA